MKSYHLLLFIAVVILCSWIIYIKPFTIYAQKSAGSIDQLKAYKVVRPSESTNHWTGNLTEQFLHKLIIQKNEANEKRLKEIAKLCKTEKSLQNPPPPLFMFGMPRLNMSITLTPKIGSTSWLAFLEKMQAPQCHIYRKSSISRYAKLHECAKPILAKFDVNQPVKAVIVRDPWRRLVSFYQHKILKEWYFNVSSCYKKWSVERNRKPFSGKPFTNPNLSFSQVVECIVDEKDPRNADSHYRPQHLLQGLCRINYTHIGSLEDIDNDLAFIFKSAQPSLSAQEIQQLIDEYEGGPRRPSEVVETAQRDQQYTKYYQSLSSELIGRVKEFYKWDLILYSYKQHPLDA